MAPSRITRRSCRSAKNNFARATCCPVAMSGHLRFDRSRPETQGMANGVGQFRAIQRIEMEFLDAVFAQALDLFDRHVRGDHPPRLRIVIQSIEALAQPCRHGRTATIGKAQQLWKTRNRPNARYEPRANPRGGTSIAIPQKYVCLEEKLGDCTAGTSVHLAFQVLQVRIDAAGLRVAFRVRR